MLEITPQRIVLEDVKLLETYESQFVIRNPSSVALSFSFHVSSQSSDTIFRGISSKKGSGIGQSKRSEVLSIKGDTSGTIPPGGVLVVPLSCTPRMLGRQSHSIVVSDMVHTTEVSIPI